MNPPVNTVPTPAALEAPPVDPVPETVPETVLVSDAVADLLADAYAAAGGWRWQDDAVCSQVGGDLWFPERGEPTHEAKRLCGWCPVRTECLDYALVNDERFGVWGGLSERERRRLRRARRTARPAEVSAEAS